MASNPNQQPQWLPPKFDGILPELRAIPNWVLAKAIFRDGRWTKPPYQANGEPASHSNPKTWSTFATVEKAFQKGDFIGVGFVLDGKAHFNGLYLHGFDWDDCIEGGATHPDVLAAIKATGISRIELSVSHTGIRGFFLHTELLRSCKTRIAGRSVELYSDKRYMITTGHGKGNLK